MCKVLVVASYSKLWDSCDYWRVVGADHHNGHNLLGIEPSNPPIHREIDFGRLHSCGGVRRDLLCFWQCFRGWIGKTGFVSLVLDIRKDQLNVCEIISFVWTCNKSYHFNIHSMQAWNHQGWHSELHRCPSVEVFSGSCRSWRRCQWVCTSLVDLEDV